MYCVGLPCSRSLQIAAVVDPREFGEFVFRMAVEVGLLSAQGVAEKHFGGQPRHRDAGVVEKVCALVERRADGDHWRPPLQETGCCSSACCFSFSAWKCVRHSVEHRPEAPSMIESS